MLLWYKFEMMTVNPAIFNEQRLEQRHHLQLIILTTSGFSKLRNGGEFYNGGSFYGPKFYRLLRCLLVFPSSTGVSDADPLPPFCLIQCLLLRHSRCFHILPDAVLPSPFTSSPLSLPTTILLTLFPTYPSRLPITLGAAN